MSNIILFQFESNEIRFVEGLPVANDVATALGYSDPAATISKKVSNQNKGVANSATPSGIQSVAVLKEPGIYQLIFASKLKSAEKFQDWVFSEVLPSIRKTGSYSIAPQPSAESLAQWHKDRTDGKEVRRTLSDAIAMFVRYAQAQGSKNADRYFASITHNLINRYVIEAPIDSKIRDKRNRMDREQLRHLTNIEDVLAGLIEARIMAGDDYHEIYQVCKDRAAAIAAVLDISPKPLLPESNQRLINQSLARSLAS